MKFPQVKPEYFPLAGGLDIVTPAISIGPGKVFDAQNYEPEISGGYRRINGFERYDGQDAPTDADYWVMTATISTTISVGASIVGATSAATGRVLGVFSSTLVLGGVSGTFIVGESLTVSAIAVATATTTAYQNGASAPSDDADYALLAANDQRQNILKVPGSGRIRGVHVFNDVLYAFRDNAAGTAGAMYRATSSGWELVTFGTEIQFTAGTNAISAGNLITGGTSGATASVVAVLIRSGSWGSSAVGTLIITVLSGTWQSGEAIKVSGTSCATSSSLATAITRLPGGRVECINANFTGSTATKKVYGADGVNLAFEFDGTNYIPIRTGMTTDTPTHVIEHRNYLILSFLGSVQLSGIGNPYAWTAVLGASEISTGSEVTGFLTQSGNGTGAALAIFTKDQTFILYGSGSSSFNLVPSIFDIGYSAYTMQSVSNNTYGLTARGIQSLLTTQNYGDFAYASVSHMIQPLITRKFGLEVSSVSLKGKNQYRLYFSDGTGLAVGLTGDKVSGIMPLNYGIAVRCITTDTLSSGTEVTYFGSDDGYVYRDNVGTSFDGQTIEAWVRPVFNHSKSPLVRKRYRRAVFEVSAEGFSSCSVGYDIGYGTSDVLAPVQVTSNQISSGGYWDQFTWDQFTWDSQYVSNVNISLDGTEKNISFLFYSNRAQDKPHTVQGVNLIYTPRRLDR